MWMEIGLGAMGLSPEVFWNMSLNEFYSALEGFKNFHSGSADEPMSRDELEELMERYPD